MEYEDSKTSSDESDKQELVVNDDVGIGRSYECVFCKRGFTTAQALGGHMNIHRRDRARNKQPAITTASSILNSHQLPVEEYGRSAGFLHSISSQSSFYSPSMETHKNYHHHHHHQMYVARPISSTGNHHNRCYINSDDHDHDQSLHFQKPPPFSLFHEDNWSTSLSLQIGSTPTYLEDKQEGRKEFNKEDELDLELRLGHDP